VQRHGPGRPRQLVERAAQRGLADVLRHVAAQRPGPGERVEQQPRLGRGARPQLDEGVAPEATAISSTLRASSAASVRVG
jgi:hypothetical protein